MSRETSAKKCVPLLPFRLAWKGLKTNPGFTTTAVTNIALGVLGFLVVVGFNDSFLAEIRSRTKAIAAADMVASSRVKPSDEAVATLRSHLPQGTVESEELSLTTMATTTTGSRLVEVRFVDEKFPMYGSLQLAQGGNTAPGVAKDIFNTNKIWIYPELQAQLGVHIGDTLKIGDVSYIISDLVLDDPTTSGLGFVLAPRIYASIDTAAETGLMQFGSRVQYMYRFKLPGNIDSDLLEQTLRTEIPNRDLRIKSHRNASEEMGRMQSYLNDYLGLVALAALFLATVGTAYLLRGHLSATIKEFGILRSLGGAPTLPAKVFAIQAVLLGLAGSLMAIVLSRILMPQLSSLMTPLTGKISTAPISLESAGIGVVMAVAGGLLMALPLIGRLLSLKPAFLFQEASVPTIAFRPRQSLYYLPALVLWWLAAVAQSHSLRNGSIFAGAFLGASIILAAWGFLKLTALAKILPKIHTRIPWKLKLALTQMARSPLASLSSFLALALGATLLNVIPQIRASVAKEIERPDTSIPQFFMFDIQDDQIDPLKEFFTNRHVTLSQPAGIVRARLDTINGQPAEQRKLTIESNREQGDRESLQTRMQNLSFRSALSASESLTEGQFNGSNWDGQSVPEMSIEQEFAKRLGLKLGDILTFDISGVAIDAKVSSFRRVRWTSFQPNFFILLQPGVLDDAPKTWVASATGIQDSDRDIIQRDLVNTWSNISVIDVKSAVRRMLTLIDQISKAIGFIAVLAVLAGLGVLFAIASHQARERRISFALLKTLGANVKQATIVSLWEYGLISIAAIALGTLVSIGVSFILSSYIFKAPWQGTWQTPVLTAVILTPISIAITWLAVRRALAVPVGELLR